MFLFHIVMCDLQCGVNFTSWYSVV